MTLSLAGCYSRPYHVPNEDSAVCVQNGAIAAVVIADGVGSSWHGDIASHAATLAFMTELEKRKKTGEIDFQELLVEVTHQISMEAQSIAGRPLEAWPASTLLSAIYDEEDDSLVICYVGDGTIWIVRGDRQAGFPVLIPTTNREGGLQHILHPEAPGDVRPVVAKIMNMSSWTGGCLAILATDGVPFDNGRTVQELSNYIFRVFHDNAPRFTKQVLSDALCKWLCEQRIDDDATIGILLTRATLELWEKES